MNTGLHRAIVLQKSARKEADCKVDQSTCVVAFSCETWGRLHNLNTVDLWGSHTSSPASWGWRRRVSAPPLAPGLAHWSTQWRLAGSLFLLTWKAFWKTLPGRESCTWEISQDCESWCLDNNVLCQTHQRKALETGGWDWPGFLGEIFFGEMISWYSAFFPEDLLGGVHPGSTYKQWDQGVLLEEE